jgi:hypothetical protein
MTHRARRPRRGSIDRIERSVATVARQTSFRISDNPGHNLHSLIVQRMKLIAAPLLIGISRQSHNRKLS